MPASRDLPTYQDAVDRLLDIFDIDRTGRDLRLARNAVSAAVRAVSQAAHWSHYDRACTIQTVASYSTGTIEYDHTGGSSERLVTLTSGTFPTWAANGWIIIDNVHYEVDSRVSSTALTLAENSNPGADVAASTTYTLYRHIYNLPTDFSKCRGVWNATNNTGIRFSDVDCQEVNILASRQTPTTPDRYTIRNAADVPFRDSLVLSPPPDAVYSLRVWYEAQPATLYTESYATGTVTVSSGATTVTGSGTSFASRHVGAVIRFSSDGTTMPTSTYGYRDGNVDNPASFQAVITAVNSGTSLTIDTAAPSTHTAVKYVISDKLDINPTTMLTAVEKWAAYEFARSAKREDVANWERQAIQAVRLAKENNQRSQDSLSSNLMPRSFVNAPTVDE